MFSGLAKTMRLDTHVGKGKLREPQAARRQVRSAEWEGTASAAPSWARAPGH